jgi:hypothetical protein
MREEPVSDARRVAYKASIGWHPRPGWGTIRNYIEVANDGGGTDIACKFIFDDRSGSVPMIWHNADIIPELEDYARGIYINDHLTIKAGAPAMISAEELFRKINAMETAKRALMFMDSSDLHEDCGWAWTHEYKLVKAAPGLIDL